MTGKLLKYENTDQEQSLKQLDQLDDFLKGVEKRAFKMARFATSNTDEALDIVQDAMTRLVKKYADKDSKEWGPLFHRILQSLIRDWYRKQKVRNRWQLFWSSDENHDDPVDMAVDTYTATPEQQLGNEFAIEELNQVLTELPLRQQQAFLLRTMEGLDTKSTANAMQCSQSSVKTHYSRALSTIRQQLETHYEGH